jgi:hypothetical protein
MIGVGVRGCCWFFVMLVFLLTAKLLVTEGKSDYFDF